MNVKGLCLLPVRLVPFIKHSVAGLQQQNLMQLQRKSFDIGDSEELPQPFPFGPRQLLLELRGQSLKWVLKQKPQWVPQTFIGVKLWELFMSEGTMSKLKRKNGTL